MRSLRLRLFAGILGAALAAVVVSLAIGVVLTRGAVRDQIADEVAGQADLLAFQLRGAEDSLAGGVGAGDAATDRLIARRLRLAPLFRRLAVPPGAPPPAGGDERRRLSPAPMPDDGTRSRSGGGPQPGDRLGLVGPPDEPLPGIAVRGGSRAAAPRPRLLTLAAVRDVLPEDAYAELRDDGAANGRADIGGERQIYSARRVGPAVALVSRPDSLTTDDFSDYLGGLLLAGALAAALAGIAAALLARRLTAPIARVGGAARALAEGRDPGRLPPERTTELAALSDSFNEMSDQLARSREAERAVLLSVSHELRTPLTAIRGYAEGIEDGTVDPKAAAEVVGREADRLGRLVGDLLALVKLEQGVLDFRSEPVDLAEAAREAARRLAPQAAAGEVAVEVVRAAAGPVRVASGGPASDASPGPGDQEDARLLVTADADRVVQVVSNLVENAIRVTPAGGAVTVAVAPGAVTVADTGPGIPAEDLEHAFDRFHLRRRHGRGSPDGAGLGLAIVRELTEAMGGSVAVVSPDGQGATFTIRLPPADR